MLLNQNIENDTCEENENIFEEQMKNQLLIEAFTEKKAEVFENVIFQGKNRYYIEDLSVRDYSLENTSPYQFKIADHIIEEKNWGGLICKLSQFLLSKYPQENSKILDFKCKWSKQTMYSLENKKNFKQINEFIYVNINHTALHSCWFIQDLLDFYKIDINTIKFLIHRPSGAEPKEVKEYIEKRFRRGFTFFLINEYNKPEAYANKVLNNIDKHLNRILSATSKSYISFFLFENKSILYNYVKITRKKIYESLKYEIKEKKILNKYLDYILAFYKY